jgi:hypothetical protein
VLIEFNGKRKDFYLTIPEQVWTECVLRYDDEQHILYFSVFDFKYHTLNEVELDIGPGLEMEVISMFAKYNRFEAEYQNIHQGLFGMVMIFEKFKTDNEITKIRNNVMPYLNQYKPTLDNTYDYEEVANGF